MQAGCSPGGKTRRCCSLPRRTSPHLRKRKPRTRWRKPPRGREQPCSPEPGSARPVRSTEAAPCLKAGAGQHSKAEAAPHWMAAVLRLKALGAFHWKQRAAPRFPVPPVIQVPPAATMPWAARFPKTETPSARRTGRRRSTRQKSLSVSSFFSSFYPLYIGVHRLSARAPHHHRQNRRPNLNFM